jgi:hypothetical protein
MTNNGSIQGLLDLSMKRVVLKWVANKNGSIEPNYTELEDFY